MSILELPKRQAEVLERSLSYSTAHADDPFNLREGDNPVGGLCYRDVLKSYCEPREWANLETMNSDETKGLKGSGLRRVAQCQWQPLAILLFQQSALLNHFLPTPTTLYLDQCRLYTRTQGFYSNVE